MKRKKGLLVVNLGTPDAPSRGAVYRYLKEFLTDGRVIDYPWLPRNLLVRGIIAPFRSGSSAKLYQRLWTPEGSPLKIYGYEVVDELRKIMPDYIIELGMRYQNPSMESAIDKLLEQNVTDIVVFPMFPQYASATTGSVHEEVMRILKKKQNIPNVNLINSYHDHPAIIDVFAKNAQQFDLKSYDHFIFSFHGIPQRQLRKADSCNHCLKKENCCWTLSQDNQFCYSAQCHGTAQAIADKLGFTKDQYTISFQSRLGPEQWTQPYTSKIIEEQLEHGHKKLLVFSPAFVSDCLETTIEIGYEYKEEFLEDGGEVLDLVPSLNADPKWINAIKDIVYDYAGSTASTV